MSKFNLTKKFDYIKNNIASEKYTNIDAYQKDVALLLIDAFQVDIPVILTPHSGHIDPPVDFSLKR